MTLSLLRRNLTVTDPDKRLVAKGIPSRKRLLDADPISVGRVTVTPSTRKRRKLHSSTHTPVLSDTDNLATYTDAPCSRIDAITFRPTLYAITSNNSATAA